MSTLQSEGFDGGVFAAQSLIGADWLKRKTRGCADRLAVDWLADVGLDRADLEDLPGLRSLLRRVKHRSAGGKAIAEALIRAHIKRRVFRLEIEPVVLAAGRVRKPDFAVSGTWGTAFAFRMTRNQVVFAWSRCSQAAVLLSAMR